MVAGDPLFGGWPHLETYGVLGHGWQWGWFGPPRPLEWVGLPTPHGFCKLVGHQQNFRKNNDKKMCLYKINVDALESPIPSYLWGIGFLLLENDHSMGILYSIQSLFCQPKAPSGFIWLPVSLVEAIFLKQSFLHTGSYFHPEDMKLMLWVL